MTTPPGRLIAFEGLDACGKSTQLRRLAARLEGRGTAVRCLREPGGTPLGEGVRELLLHGPDMGRRAETLLYMAARAELYEAVVAPALERGEVVLLDRSHYSTLAYQGAGLGLDREEIRELARQATGGRAPDRVVLLQVPVDVSLQRLAAGEQAADRVERRPREFFVAVAQAFDALAREEPLRFRVVDGTGDPDAVEVAVREALDDVV